VENSKILIGIETEFLPTFFSFFSPIKVNIFEVFALIKSFLFVRYNSFPSGVRKKDGLFLENSIKVNYEATLKAPFQGFLEFSTPEVFSPISIIRYKREIEEIIKEIIAFVESAFSSDAKKKFGMETKPFFSINKITEDINHNTLGENENYFVKDTDGIFIKIIRGILFPILFLFFLTSFLFFIALDFIFSLIYVALFILILVLLALIFPTKFINHKDKEDDIFSFGTSVSIFSTIYFKSIATIIYLAFLPFEKIFSFYCRHLILVKLTDILTPFLISRIVYAGVGGLNIKSKKFLVLSPKATIINSEKKIFFDTKKKPIYDFKNFFFSPKAIFSKYKRLHILFSDSNMSDYATFLKVGTTKLVIDTIINSNLFEKEKIHLLIKPTKLLSLLNQDITFSFKFPVLVYQNGKKIKKYMDVLELQRFYINKVKKYISQVKPISYDDYLVLKHWDKVLSALERKDMDFLSKNIDWAIKFKIFHKIIPDNKMKEIHKKIQNIGSRKLKKILLGKTKPKKISDTDIKPIKKLFVANFLYSDIRNGLFFELKENGFLDRWNFLEYYGEIPPKNRVYERILIMKKLKEKGYKAKISWDKIVFWDKFNKKQKIYLPNPYGGNIDTTGKFLSLIENLSSSPSFKVYDI
jgi:hypothetical protein